MFPPPLYPPPPPPPPKTQAWRDLLILVHITFGLTHEMMAKFLELWPRDQEFGHMNKIAKYMMDYDQEYAISEKGQVGPWLNTKGPPTTPKVELMEDLTYEACKWALETPRDEVGRWMKSKGIKYRIAKQA